MLATLVVAGATAAWAPAAGASGPITVPLGTAGAMTILYDARHSYVLIAERDLNRVVVYTPKGVAVATFDHQAGAAGMVIVGNSLYVAHSTDGSIHQINLKTLTDQGALVSGLKQPYWLAYAGHKLWVTVSLNSWTGLTSVDPKTKAVTAWPTQYYEADLATSPALPDDVFVAEDGLSPGSVRRLDVHTGSPTQTAVNPFTDQSNIEQLAVSPDGTRVIPASGAPYQFEEMSTSTLAYDGVIYPGQPHPSAVAVAARTPIVATGLRSGYSSPDLQVFELGVPQAYWTATTMPPGGVADVPPHGLALTPNGRQLFALTANVDGSGAVLHIFKVPAAP